LKPRQRQAAREAIDWDNLIVSVTTLAGLLGVSPQSVAKYAREGDMPRAATKGAYPLKACLQWNFKRLKDLAASSDGDLIEERRRLIVEQRRGHELGNAERRGELLSADQVATTLNAIMADIASGLDSLGPRLANRLATVNDPAIIQRTIFDECRNLRRAAAGRLHALALDYDGGEDSGRAAATKRGTVGRRTPDTAAGEPGAGAVAN
jgi:phage terminase Nu1 subunit (DNA packaging protein)